MINAFWQNTGMTVTSQRPQTNEYKADYAKYIDLVPETDILISLEDQEYHIWRCLDQFREGQALQRYAPDKWSVKEVLGHLVDTERVLGHQLLYAVRKDPTVLPKHDSELWVQNSDFDQIDVEDLMTEWTALRTAHLCLLKRLSMKEWNSPCLTGSEYSIRALAYLLVGHIRYHLKIMNERYTSF